MGKELGIEGSAGARSLAPIELKELAGTTGTISLIPNEKRVAEDRRDCYWLYVVTDCDNEPRLHVNKDPASLPWHEVKKADHYWLSVNAVRGPMRVREEAGRIEEDSEA
jgi:Domain of unknown function (DUF3883)